MDNQKIKFFISEKAEINETDRTIIHYASTNEVDRDSEIVLPEGIVLENFKKNPVVLWNHMSWSHIPPIAKSLWQKVDSKGLLVSTQFAKTEFGDEVFGLYKDGFLTSWSIGFMPIDWKDKNNIRTISKCEMFEYSAVSVPANAGAVCLSFVKGLKSAQIKEAFINDYLLDSFDNEIKSLKSTIQTLKEAPVLDYKELIKQEIANSFEPRFNELNSKLANFKLEKQKSDMAAIIEEVIKRKLG